MPSPTRTVPLLPVRIVARIALLTLGASKVQHSLPELAVRLTVAWSPMPDSRAPSLVCIVDADAPPATTATAAPVAASRAADLNVIGKSSVVGWSPRPYARQTVRTITTF